MKVAIHDPDRVSSPEGDRPDLGKEVKGKLKAMETVWLTELKRHRIKLGYISRMWKSKEPLNLPTENDSEVRRSQSDSQG